MSECSSKEAVQFTAQYCCGFTGDGLVIENHPWPATSALSDLANNERPRAQAHSCIPAIQRVCSTRRTHLGSIVWAGKCQVEHHQRRVERPGVAEAVVRGGLRRQRRAGRRIRCERCHGGGCGAARAHRCGERLSSGRRLGRVPVGECLLLSSGHAVLAVVIMETPALYGSLGPHCVYCTAVASLPKQNMCLLYDMPH